MGIFYDLYQSFRIDETETRADTLARRVARLESELAHTRRTLRDVIRLPEEQSQRDLNGDGKIG